MFIRSFRSPREEGQGLVEYALILVLVAVVVIAVMLQLGPEIRLAFGKVTAVLQGAGVITDSSGAIASVNTSFTPASYSSPATLKVTVTVSDATTVTVTGDGLSGTLSHTFSGSGSHTFTITNPSASSGWVTVTDSSGGQGVDAWFQ